MITEYPPPGSLTQSHHDAKKLNCTWRLCVFALNLLALLLASCGIPAEASPAPAPVSPTLLGRTEEADSPAPIPHASEIRFALIGEPTDVNAWALFDQAGASYANYALRWEYWPRLYTLSIPDRQFTPMAAEGLPSPVTHEGDFYVGIVSLRSGLSWTDGTPFTAEDVAFTVNTALIFKLGFDWKAYYNFDFLDHAQAVDSSTVKFYFKKPPNVGLWQYGALQGPILQKAYWQPRVAGAAELLPDDAMRTVIVETEQRRDLLQKEVDQLETRLLALKQIGVQDHQLEGEIRRKQGDLDGTISDLAELNDETAVKIEAAHQALYALDDANEPTLGSWMPASEESGVWVNEVNPDSPFEKPHFDHAVYRAYADEDAAVTALENDEIDVILTPNGLSTDVALNRVEDNPSLNLVYNATSSARFVVINPSNTALSDPVLRRALSCATDRGTLVRALIAVPLESFVLPVEGYWQNTDVLDSCAGLAGYDRRVHAIEILKSAGYTWQTEPTDDQPGEGLTLPDGTPLPAITLLAPFENADHQRAEAAQLVEQFVSYIGVHLVAKFVSAEDIRYSVYSSRQYDMAIIGWRLSAYPGYLCEWFQPPSPFAYDAGNLESACRALKETADLETARRYAFEIQSILMEDLPFIPLYQGMIYEAYRNINYPFAHMYDGNVLDGIGPGSYGAPSLAIPSP